MITDEQCCRSNGLTRESSFNDPACFLREMIFRKLALLDYGNLFLWENFQCHQFGNSNDGISASVRINSTDFYKKVALGGSIGAAEAYMDGLWDCDDLTSLVRILVRNQKVLAGMEGGSAKLTAFFQRFLHRLHDNSRSGSRKNIAAHYDLGNDFYRLFLDPTMAYSCGIFEREDSTMEEASMAKFQRICEKLLLAPGMSLLEIGAGWGGFAIYAAQRYGCHVTATTISREQYSYAARKIREAGLDDRITLLCRDYRDLEGHFDRLVSIEMIEAVGHRHLPTFFQVCGERLKPEGMALIQAITMPDHLYDRYLKGPDFINRYIFPGGCCPALKALASACSTTDLRLIHLEELSQHYVRTLQEWRTAFHLNLQEVRWRGFPERFIRMWNYYLCYCEGGFAERYTGLLQLLYARPDFRMGPLPGEAEQETG